MFEMHGSDYGKSNESVRIVSDLNLLQCCFLSIFFFDIFGEQMMSEHQLLTRLDFLFVV